MSKKDYIKFAEMLKRNKPEEYENMQAWVFIVQQTADIFADDNPNFGRDRFYDACDYITPLHSNKR